jgi:hypothetical protein
MSRDWAHQIQVRIKRNSILIHPHDELF